jgi:hypothetical protein
MMHEDEKRNENETTPKGAVEIEETDLDQAAGGASQIPDPMANASWWFAGQKAVPQDPSIGLLNEPQKKI